MRAPPGGPCCPLDLAGGVPRRVSFLEYLQQSYDNLLEQSLAHIQLTLISVGGAVVIGVVLGIIAHRTGWLAPLILNTESTLLTIPSLALFAILIPIVGIGSGPPIVGLTLYALLPITRNTVAGLRSVDAAIVESARGMGMGGFRRLARIELPIAWPVILTGIRVATLLVVGIAAVAALVGGPGLGNEIYTQGIRRLGTPFAGPPIIGGTLAIIILAILFDLFYLLIGRLTTPRGIR